MSKTALEIVRELAAARDKEEALKKQEEEKRKAIIKHWEPVTKIIREIFDAYPGMGTVVLLPSNSARVTVVLARPIMIEEPSLGLVNEFRLVDTSVYGYANSDYILHTAESVGGLIPYVVSLMADAVRAYDKKKS